MKISIQSLSLKQEISLFLLALSLLAGTAQNQVTAQPATPRAANAVSIFGTIYKDGNGNTDNIINGMPYADEEAKMYVVITNNSFEKVGEAPVIGGHYEFSGLEAGIYSIYITPDPTSQGPSLPGSYWAFTSPGGVVVDTRKTSGQVDFGINQLPFAVEMNYEIPQPYQDLELRFNGDQGQLRALEGTDLEDGIIGAIGTTTVVITRLPDFGQLIYDNVPITSVFHDIPDYNPELLSYRFLDGRYYNTRFSFSFRDKAGSLGPSVDYAFRWENYIGEAPTYKLSGNLLVDADGVTDDEVNGTPYNGDVQMYAVLLNGEGQRLLQTRIVNSKYAFNDLPNGYYSVVVTSESGSSYSQVPTSAWAFTGEQIGTPGYDSYVNGQLFVQILHNHVSEANFGMEQLPVSIAENVRIAQPVANQMLTFNGKPGQLPALSGWDAEDGQLGQRGSVVTITKLPQEGELLYNFPSKGLTPISEHDPIINFDPERLVLKLTGTGYTLIDFSFAFVDAANKRGPGNWYTIRWDGALPVLLKTFKASVRENSAILNWETTSEVHSDHFEIEHSADAKTWQTVGSVAAANESNSSQEYRFEHNGSHSGDQFYRLKMIDADGTFAYSRIEKVFFEKQYQFKICPNPAHEQLSIESGMPLTECVIRIYDMKGLLQMESDQTRNVDIRKLQPGNYVVAVLKRNAVLHSSVIVIN